MRQDFEPVVNVLHFRMDRFLRTDFAAKAASNAEALFDLNFNSLLKNAHLVGHQR